MTRHLTAAADPAEVTVDPAEVAWLRAGLAGLIEQYSTADDPRFLRAVPGLGRLLPSNVHQALRAMRYEESCSAVVVRGGLPEVPLVPTPSGWQSRPPMATLLHDMWLVLLVAQLGDPMGWSYLQDGRLLNDILPQRGDEYGQNAFGSAAELDFHVEEADQDRRSDAFGLLCLRNPDAVATTVASVAMLDLSTLDVDTLFQPRFRIGGDDDYLVRPVLFGEPSAPYLRIDAPYTRPEPGDGAAAEALSALLDQLSANLTDVVLRPGDVLVVDNLRAVHGRRSFQARFDGNDRWLRRVSAVRDLRSFRLGHSAARGDDDRVVRLDA